MRFRHRAFFTTASSSNTSPTSCELVKLFLPISRRNFKKGRASSSRLKSTSPPFGFFVSPIFPLRFYVYRFSFILKPVNEISLSLPLSHLGLGRSTCAPAKSVPRWTRRSDSLLHSLALLTIFLSFSPSFSQSIYLFLSDFPFSALLRFSYSFAAVNIARLWLLSSKRCRSGSCFSFWCASLKRI